MKSTRQQPKPTKTQVRGLSECVKEVMDAYFKDLDGHEAADLHELVISQVEKPLLEAVLKNCNGNITRAARALGLNRGTVLSRLKKYRLTR